MTCAARVMPLPLMTADTAAGHFVAARRLRLEELPDNDEQRRMTTMQTRRMEARSAGLPAAGCCCYSSSS